MKELLLQLWRFLVPHEEEIVDDKRSTIEKFQPEIIAACRVVLATIRIKGDGYVLPLAKLKEIEIYLENTDRPYSVKEDIEFWDDVSRICDILLDKLRHSEFRWHPTLDLYKKVHGSLDVLNHVIAFEKYMDFAKEKKEQFEENLDIVVGDERYEDAAKLRDVIQGMEEQFKRSEL